MTTAAARTQSIQSSKAAPAVGEAINVRIIADINASIMDVVRATRGVYFMAINAMLISRHAGQRSKGFAVVSSELRVFSRNMERIMAEMETLMQELTRDTAVCQKARREQRQLQAATDATQCCPDWLAQVMSRKTSALQSREQALARSSQRLAVLVHRALRTCTVGVALSRSGKIEAVYGGDVAGQLNQVSEQAEQIVGHALDILKSLEKRITL